MAVPWRELANQVKGTLKPQNQTLKLWAARGTGQVTRSRLRVERKRGGPGCFQHPRDPSFEHPTLTPSLRALTVLDAKLRLLKVKRPAPQSPMPPVMWLGRVLGGFYLFGL